MTISLPSNLESRLREQARLHGLDPSEYARRLLDEHLAASSSGPAPGSPTYGSCRGMLTIAAGDDEHLKDFGEYMR